jgi:arginine:ornithine antiporter/lysine permease
LPTPGRWGEYLSFNSAWGYWISAWIGNVSYLVILFAALSYFFPLFGEGNNKAAIAGASVVLWSLHWMILRGMRTAARANALTTVAKIVPLLLFIGLVIAAFQRETFSVDFWARRHWAAPGPGQKHHAGHRLGVHRHRRRQRVFRPCGGARQRRARHGDRLCDHPVAVDCGVAVVLGRAQTTGAGGAEKPSMAGVLQVAAGPWARC